MAAHASVWTRPSVGGVGDDADRQTIVATLAKVARYANEMLKLEPTLTGNGHELDEGVGMHLHSFAVYEYQPHPRGELAKVLVHTDSDFEGRCLSAGLHLDNWFAEEDGDDGGGGEEEPHKSAGGGAGSPRRNHNITGGVFQTLRCKAGGPFDCRDAKGHKLVKLYEDMLFKDQARHHTK